VGSRLSHQSKTLSYIRTEGGRLSEPHGKSIKRRRVGSAEIRQEVPERGTKQVEGSFWGWGKKPGLPSEH
jgi:hypothetical protein